MTNSPLVRLTKRTVSLVLTSPGFATLLLLAFILLNGVSFYILYSLPDFDYKMAQTNSVYAEDSRREAGGAVRIAISYLLYFGAVLIALAHRRSFTAFLRANPHFVALFALILAGTLWSIDPGEVVRNCIQLMVGLAIAIAFAVTHVDKPYRSLCTVVLAVLLPVHFGSIVLFVVNGLDYTAFLGEDGLRYGGLPGHPNTLGGQVVIGCWAALVIVLDKSASRWGRGIGVFSLIVFAITVSTTGSATAWLGASIVILATVTMKFLETAAAHYRVPVILALVFVALVGGGVLYIQFGADEILTEVTGSVGKDATLTGRTDLWETGMHAIREHPFRGWAYDNHETVMDVPDYAIRHPHYHNGLIDTWVEGGFFVLLLVLYEMWLFLSMSARSLTVDPGRAILLPAFAFLLILNLTEYSLLRPLSIIYEIYLCAWALLWYGSNDRAPGRSRADRDRHGKPRRKRRHATIAFS